MSPRSAGPKVELERRLAAAGALALAVAAIAVAAVAMIDDVGRIIAVAVSLLVMASASWIAATRRGKARIAGAAVSVAAAALVVVVVLTGEHNGLALVLMVALLAGSTVLSRPALLPELRAAQEHTSPTTPVGPANRGVLIMNLKSGGGKAEQFGLEDECRRRGIEPVVLQPGDDLLVLAREAIEGGADVIGMAGGDGSQALVASVAMQSDVAMVCIPAGTRNHFALDLGVDREDVVGSLDAFGDALERRIDLAEVGDRVFVNNVSLGVYAKIVHSPEYRDAKRQTTSALLPELLGPEAEPFDLHFAGPDGTDQDDAQIIQVSNNPYVLTAPTGFGSRARLDTGELGIAAASVHGATEVAALVAAASAGRLDRFSGWTEWTTPTFVVESGGPVEAGVDGEALVLDPPLEFRLLPGALRVRIALSAPGYSPAAAKPPSAWWTARALVRVAAGKPVSTDDRRPDPGGQWL